jgi:hypothetical protein
MLTSARTVQAGRLAIAVFVALLVLSGTRVARAQSSTTTVRDGWVAERSLAGSRSRTYPTLEQRPSASLLHDSLRGGRVSTSRW